jgi:outer membrane protein OmpA-like peptidoglycan-associated protein/tetratricopeptide (TPR) repeat protein
MEEGESLLLQGEKMRAEAAADARRQALARYHIRLGLTQLLNAYALQPDNARLNYGIGKACLYLGRADEALAFLTQAADRSPNERAGIEALLGQACLHKGELDEAAAHYRQALAHAKSAKEKKRLNAQLAVWEYAKSRMNDALDIWVKNFGATVNTEASEFFPAVQENGASVLFLRMNNGVPATFRTSAKGQTWSAAVPVGQKADTHDIVPAAYRTENDKSIKIHPAMKAPGSVYHPHSATVYFSAVGAQTMGGFDIYRSEWDGKKWSAPQNMGYPVNSTGDDIIHSLSDDGNKLYISSDRYGGYGDYDLYIVYLASGEPEAPAVASKEPEVRYPAVVRGRVAEEDTGVWLQSITVHFTNLNTNETESVLTDESGNFQSTLTAGIPYELHIDEDGYFPHAETLIFDGRQGQKAVKEIRLTSTDTISEWYTEAMTDSILNRYAGASVAAAVLVAPLLEPEAPVATSAAAAAVLPPEEPETAEWLEEETEEEPELEEEPEPDTEAPVAEEDVDFAATEPYDDDDTLTDDDTQEPEEPLAIDTSGTLMATIFFDLDRANLSDSAMIKIGQLARWMKAAQQPLRLVGFTDAVGGDEYNHRLTLRRMKAIVTGFLLQGIDEKDLLFVHEPLPPAPALPMEIRKNNNRIEVQRTIDDGQWTIDDGQ